MSRIRSGRCHPEGVRWWTSDLHFGHANIISYSGRPFADTAEMDAALVSAWNHVVAASDEVWVVGDVAMGRIAENLSLVGQLAGRKVLVPGNHDRCWAGQPKGSRRWLTAYHEAGFADIVEGPVAVTIGSTRVLVDHFPYRGDSQAQERYLAYRPPDRGEWLLHGHVHDRWRQSCRQINVGVDAWGGGPVNDATIAQLISAGCKELPALPWGLGPRACMR